MLKKLSRVLVKNTRRSNMFKKFMDELRWYIETLLKEI